MKIKLQRLLKQMAYLLVFGWFAVMEASELFALFPAYGDPGKLAHRIGLRESFAVPHLVIASLLIGLVILLSVLTVANIMQKSPKMTLTARLAGLAFVLYGGYQLYVAFTQSTNPVASLGGIVYIVIGAAAFGLAPKSSKL